MFDATVRGTITLNGSELSITDDLTITGPGAELLAVSGNHASRVFRVGSFGAMAASISGLTIENGSVVNNAGGGILNGRTLTVTGCVFIGNSTSGDSGSRGGAIGNFGTLTIAGSTFTNNSAAGNGGAIYSNTLNVYLTVNDSSFTGNTAGADGGAIWTNERAMVLNSTLSDNSAMNGGGLYGSLNSIMLNVVGCTISNNSASNDGGGIWAEGRLTVNGSTIAGNSARDGGGIWLAGRLDMTNSTLAGNSAPTPVVASTATTPLASVTQGVEGGSKRRRRERVGAVESGGAHGLICEKWQDRGVSPYLAQLRREAQECDPTWSFGKRFVGRC